MPTATCREEAPLTHNPMACLNRDHRYQGQDYVGLTCAACHRPGRAQQHRHRIDGGGAEPRTLERFAS